MGVEEEGPRGQRVCMQCERVNVWQENTVIMLIFLFLFAFKMLEEYFLLLSFFFIQPLFCHLCCPLLCYGKGGQRNRNLGIRSIMDGGLLIRVKERKQEKEGVPGERSETAGFFPP